MLRTALLFSILCAQGVGWASDDLASRIWRGSFAQNKPQEARSVKVLSWNIERGARFEAVQRILVRNAPELLLLQEVDLNARRSGGRHVSEEIARSLLLNYVFAAEFEELGQRVGSSPAYHGQAILTSLPIGAARIVRFREQSHFWRPRWFLPNWPVFQRRRGGRLALVTEVGRAEAALVVCNVHLESRGSEDRRLSQIEDLLKALQAYGPATPIIIAGDLNVRGPTSPVIHRLRQARFRKALGGAVTTQRGAALDWVFVRGPLTYQDAVIHDNVRASDHYPLTLRLSLTGGGS